MAIRIGERKQLSREWVVLLFMDILICHVNDVISRNARSEKILWIKLRSYTYIISTTGVTGVGIVTKASISLEDNGVLIGENNRKKGKSENQNLVHLFEHNYKNNLWGESQ